MERMTPTIINSIAKYFDLFVRWAYPGMLFLLLLKLGRPDFFGQLQFGTGGIFEFIVPIFVFSFIIYSFHRYLLHEFIVVLLHFLGYAVTARLSGENLPKDWSNRSGIFKFYSLQKIFFIKRLRKKEKEEKHGDEIEFGDRFSEYLLNRWAVTHAIGLTTWLFPLIYWFSGENSCLKNLLSWPVVILITIAFGIGMFHGILLLTEVETAFADDYFGEFMRYDKMAKTKRRVIE